MPRIDPLQLLKCLGVLLKPDGGIKSESEVQRLASLMTKFSKKLVSKCIYVQILKCSETKLLGLFMASGGWTLAHMWLTDGILSKNWALVQELLELLLLCPVHVELLKTNNCPKLVKGLSKDESHEGVRILAGKLVEQWLRIVKGENQNSSTTSPSGSSSINGDDNYLNSVATETSTTHVTYNSFEQSTNDSTTPTDKLNSSPKQNVVTCNNTLENNDSLVLNNSVGFKSEVKNLPHLPVYKITLKDGKQVLAKIHPNPEKIPRIEKEKIKDSEITSEKENESQKEVSKEKEKDASKDKSKDKTKHKSSKDKDRRHSGSSSTKSSSSSSRSSSSNSKHSSSKSSSSHRSSSSKSSSSSSSSSHSHNSSRDKDKSKERRSSSSSKSSSSSSRDKEKDKANQIEKDKATLDKLKQPTIDKLGKIPKKPRLEDGSKISSSPKSESKKPSISIEVRQNTGEQTLRPKTVKTFNSKFRSHGLEEEAKPAPPRTLKKTTSVAPIVPPILKRTSPPRYDIIPEKKAKIAEAPVNAKPGAIKLIPAKPKPALLMESDMFMDALTSASSKKEPRKRKRKLSNSKESSEGPPSPTNPRIESPTRSLNSSDATEECKPSEESKTVAPVLPRFYQDTLDNDDDKDKIKKENENSESETTSANDIEEKDKTTTNDEIKMEVEKTETEESPAEPDAENIDSSNEAQITRGKTDGPKGVLLYTKKKGPKKKLKWKPEKDLVDIQYFELDETERVNVTKTFIDMKHMEHCNEREAFQMARKLTNEDTMEEKMMWRELKPVDGVTSIQFGKNSREKDVQYAREKVVLPVLYYRTMIPDTPTEPDVEVHSITDPVNIPLEDVTGNSDTVNDFQNTPWPEPKGSPPQAAAGIPPQLFPPFPPGPGFAIPPFGPGFGPGGPIGPGMPEWRGPPGPDGMNMMNMPPEIYNGMYGPGMGPDAPFNGNLIDGGNISGDIPNGGFPPHFPPFSNNAGFPPGPGPSGMGPPGNSNGPPGPGGRGGGMGMRGGRGGMGPRGPNGGWFRPQGSGPSWQGGPRGGGGNWNGGSRGVCHQFQMKGFCRQGDKCNYMHPGVNCPPY